MTEELLMSKLNGPIRFDNRIQNDCENLQYNVYHSLFEPTADYCQHTPCNNNC